MTKPDEQPPIDQVHAVGTLGEPSRRKLYDYIASVDTWVGRDEAAEAAGLQRGVAAHHLDRLADEGLLEIDYQRLTGRSGPGAGRPAKVYRRSTTDIGVSLPPRDYEFAGNLLADAIAESQAHGTDVAESVTTSARQAGERLGRTAAERSRSLEGPDREREALVTTLRDHGFEPHRSDDGTIVLHNCPFHLLAQRHTDMICGMNHTLIAAAIDEIGDDSLHALLCPDPETCCVRIRTDSTDDDHSGSGIVTPTS